MRQESGGSNKAKWMIPFELNSAKATRMHWWSMLTAEISVIQCDPSPSMFKQIYMDMSLVDHKVNIRPIGCTGPSLWTW